MTTRGRIASTAALGALLGLATLILEDGGFPTAGIDAAVRILAAILFLVVPVIVGRWWVVLAMAGPALALLIMQAADVAVSLDDGTGPAINYRTIIQFLVLSAFILMLGAGSHLFARQSDQPG